MFSKCASLAEDSTMTLTKVCSPMLDRVVQGKCNQRRMVLAAGALLVYIIGKKTSSILTYRNTMKKIERKQKKLKASMKWYEERYGELSSDQAAIVALDFPELKERLRDGSLTAVEVLEAFIAKAIQVTKINNSVTEFIDGALERARELDALPASERGPLHGLPISLKEHIAISGLDCTVGIPSNLEKPAPRDAELVRHLKSLGAVPFCRTNLSQTCISFDCTNPIYGLTVNPRNPKRSPGGSSGGEGALIGGGGSVMGFGSDLGGSVRFPAIFSGITSLKPTAGRMPLHGQGSDGGLIGVVGLHNTIGFMARSARGIEECMKEMLDKEMVGRIGVDPRFVPLQWREEVAKTGKKLKIGWYDYDGCMEITPGMKRVVSESVSALRSLGHEVVPFTPVGLDEVNELYVKLSDADEGKKNLELLEGGPVDMLAIGYKYNMMRAPILLRRLLKPIINLWSPINAAGMTAQDSSSKSSQLWELNYERLGFIERILRQWEENDIDVVLSPGLVMPATPMGYPAYLLGTISYTHVWNLLNFPAGSVPVSNENAEDQAALANYPGYEVDPVYGWVKDATKGAEGMSLNVQFIGKPWQEEKLLRIMKELQEKLNLKQPY